MVRFYHQCANVLGTHRSQVISTQQNGTKEIGNETKPIEVEGVIDTTQVVHGNKRRKAID